MASPLGNQSPGTPIPPEGNNSSPSSSPDGSPRSGNMRSRKVEPLDPSQVSQEDIIACQRNLDLRTEEVFQLMGNTTDRAQANVRELLDICKEQQNIIRNVKEENSALRWQRLILIITVVVLAVLAVTFLCLFLL